MQILKSVENYWNWRTLLIANFKVAWLYIPPLNSLVLGTKVLLK